MFKHSNQHYGPSPQNAYPYHMESQIQRLYYEVQENNRKIRNLNRRVRRIENYLNIRKSDSENELYDE